MLELLIGSAVGTFGVYFWSWRRARAARAQERTSTSEFERTLRRARDNFAVARYSVPLDGHAHNALADSLSLAAGMRVLVARGAVNLFAPEGPAAKTAA